MEPWVPLQRIEFRNQLQEDYDIVSMTCSAFEQRTAQGQQAIIALQGRLQESLTKRAELQNSLNTALSELRVARQATASLLPHKVIDPDVSDAFLRAAVVRAVEQLQFALHSTRSDVAQQKPLQDDAMAMDVEGPQAQILTVAEMQPAARPSSVAMAENQSAIADSQLGELASDERAAVEESPRMPT